MRIAILVTLCLAAPLFAQPVITGITPTEGPTSGGTLVTITGSGFEADTGVSFVDNVFGHIRPHAVKVVDSTTIIATTPAHPAGAVTLWLSQGRSTTPSKTQFVYVGSDSDAVRRYLVPVLPPPVAGANGAEFRSVLRFWNAGNRDVAVRGLPQSGVICDLCRFPPFTVIGPDGAFSVSSTLPWEATARWIDVANDDGSLAMNLRVYDTSRSATNLGTEIPVVPLDSFRDRVDLTAIPIDSRYRLMLRVYGDIGGVAGVTFGSDYREVLLTSRSPDHYPSYAEVALSQGNLPQGTVMNLSVASEGILGSPVVSRIWAFVTVTNNETQHITTITPQPSR